MRGAQVDGSSDILYAERLGQVPVHIADCLCNAVAAVLCGASLVEQQQAEQTVYQLGAGGLAQAFIRRTAAQQAVKQAGDFGIIDEAVAWGADAICLSGLIRLARNIRCAAV